MKIHTHLHVRSRYVNAICICVGAAILFATFSACGGPTSPTPLSAPSLVSPINGGYVQQNDPATKCRYDPVYGYGFMVTFEWRASTPAKAVSSYEIQLKNSYASIPLLEQPVRGTRYDYVACNIAIDGDGWQWKVRARTSDGRESEWSTPYYLNFTSCRLANGLHCAEQPPD